MPLSPGDKLGPYEILAQIGEGGMAVVYRATDTRLGRDVALKILPAEMARDADRLARFQREARAVAALNHPNVVTLHSVEHLGDINFLTMELVEGQPLEGMIPEGGFPAERIIEIASALAEALAAAHDKGLVHRDLKPANIMIASDGRIKVLDFGLAKDLRGASLTNVTVTSIGQTEMGVVMGTPPYMSPEQISGREIDSRSDLFSLGIILHEMTTGRRPFGGESAIELAASILRDTPAPVTGARTDLPGELVSLIEQCLVKDANGRIQSARLVLQGLHKARLQLAPAESRPATPPPALKDEGFMVAVLPFKHKGSNADIEALAEGLSEEIVTGLSRFSYLRLITGGSAVKYDSQTSSLRIVGTELGAMYVMEGNLRTAGPTVRVAVQLIDAATGARLWAETYDRLFQPEAVFAIQDELAPRIVSTVADAYGALPHAMSQAVRSKDAGRLTPYEALLRSFGYVERVTAEEHAVAKTALERAVQQAPGSSDCWAMLSILLTDEYIHGFTRSPDPLERALQAARRAVDAGIGNHKAHQALAWALFFRKEFQPSRAAAERTLALNPMDASAAVHMGQTIAFGSTLAEDWQRGCEGIARAIKLNPNHPGWYWYALFLDAYRGGDYRAALDIALKINMPECALAAVALAAVYGQLGEREAAGGAVRDLVALRPDYAAAARSELEKFWRPQLVDHLLDGLRKAGFEVEGARERMPAAPAARDALLETQAVRIAAVAIAVLPFADMSPLKDQQFLCEGMAEEIMNALVRIEGIRVASRTSAFRAKQDGGDLAAIGRALSVGHVLDGSVRTSGSRIRVTAQLTDVASGYQLWSERYDREAADVFAVQDEIAAGVVEAVKARLAPSERTTRARTQAGDLEAYRCYLMGRHLRFTKEDLGGAFRAFEEAVRLDPSHAPSWVGLAEACILMAFYSLIPARGAYAKAKAALATAARLQGESADGIYILGQIAFGERDWPAWEADTRRAIQLEPRHVSGLGSFGLLLCARQRYREAMDIFQRAREADPLAAFPYAVTGLGLLIARKPTESERYFEDALGFEKEHTLGLLGSGIAAVALGRYDEGIATLERGLALTHRAALFAGALGWALAVAGRTDVARALLDELRGAPDSAPTAVSETWLLAALGETDGAFEALARAEEESQIFVCFTGLPGFDPLRADPRFAALLGRLGLTH